MRSSILSYPLADGVSVGICAFGGILWAIHDFWLLHEAHETYLVNPDRMKRVAERQNQTHTNFGLLESFLDLVCLLFVVLFSCFMNSFGGGSVNSVLFYSLNAMTKNTGSKLQFAFQDVYFQRFALIGGAVCLAMTYTDRVAEVLESATLVEVLTASWIWELFKTLNRAILVCYGTAGSLQQLDTMCEARYAKLEAQGLVPMRTRPKERRGRNLGTPSPPPRGRESAVRRRSCSPGEAPAATRSRPPSMERPSPAIKARTQEAVTFENIRRMLSVNFYSGDAGIDVLVRSKGGSAKSSRARRSIQATANHYLQSLLFLTAVLSITVFGAWSNLGGGSAIRDFLFFRKFPEIPNVFYFFVVSAVIMEISFPAKTYLMPYILTISVLVGDYL
jgi:hypothetical protein